MLMTQNSVMNLLIGKKLTRTVNAQLLDSTNATTYLAAGELLVTDASGTVLDSTTVVGKKSIRIAQGQGATLPLIWSDEIFHDNVTSWTGKSYTAGTVQIDYVGFDSVTNLGSIDVISSNDYSINMFDVDSTTFGTLGNNVFGFYTSDATATQLEIAKGLTESLFTNTRDLVFPSVLIEMVTDLATYVAASVVTYTFTNGSPNVTVSAGTTVVAGDLIRVATNADTIAVYYVEAKGVTAFTGAGVDDFRINYAYQGASSAGTAVFRNTVAPTQFGVRITGKAPYYVSPNTTNYHVNRFKTTINNAGSTAVVTEQNATEGSGLYEQVSQLEYFLVGNEGPASRYMSPQFTTRTNVETTGTYDIYSLAHFRQEGGQIMGSPKQYKQLMVAGNMLAGNGTNMIGAVTSFQDVMNAWLPTFTAVSL